MERRQEVQCYWPSMYHKPTDPWVGNPGGYPCGPHTEKKATGCCWTEATCMSSGLCYHDALDIDDQYYVGGCTDQLGDDPACPPWQECGPSWSTNVVYLGNNTWQCCFGLTNVSHPCENPIGVKFSAPPPSTLDRYSYIDSNGVAHTLQKNTPKHLSGGEISGIAVGCTAFGVVIVLFGLFIRYKTRRSGHRKTEDDVLSVISSDDEDEWVAKIRPKSKAESSMDSDV